MSSNNYHLPCLISEQIKDEENICSYLLKSLVPSF